MTGLLQKEIRGNVDAQCHAAMPSCLERRHRINGGRASQPFLSSSIIQPTSMGSEERRVPTEETAVEIARLHSGHPPDRVARFPTGLSRYVYDVVTAGGARIVVRIGTVESRPQFAGASYWWRILRPLGVRLPGLLGEGEHRGFPYLVLERLAGDDLGVVYSKLRREERRAIASEIWCTQRIVHALGEGKGFGYALSDEGPFQETWASVLDRLLARSRARLEATGQAGTASVDRVQRHAQRFARYLGRVRPTPFLDDTTTKNVIVHHGRFSGIVDVDWVCFGDPLFTVALTRTALLSMGESLDYTDYWCELLELTPQQHEIVRFYTALFCVDFMSELGQRFNQASASSLPADHLLRLETILADQLIDA